MSKYKDEEGNEVEGTVITDEDLQKRIDEVKNESLAEVEKIKTEYETKLSENQASIDALKKDKEDIESKMAGENEGSANFKILKEALDKKDEKINGLEKSVKEQNSLRENDIKEAIVKDFVGKDEELKKKLEFHYKETLASVKAVSQEEIRAKIENAYKLSRTDNTPSPLDVARGNSSFGDNASRDGNQNKFSDSEKRLGNRLGISDEDYKKYENDPRLNN